MRTLRAVTAIFGTTTGFDTQQGTDLYSIGIKILPVNGLRLVHQIRKWQIKQGFNFRLLPVMAERRGLFCYIFSHGLLHQI